MNNNYCIIVGESDACSYYVSNISPIIWDTDISKSKKIKDFNTAKIYLNNNFIVLANTIVYTSMNGIFIDEYNEKNEFVKREKVL